MNNDLWNKLDNVVKINIKGKNVVRFIKRLHTHKIEMWDIDRLSKDEVNLKVYNKDLDNILEAKTIYEVSIIDYYGKQKIKKSLKKYQVFLFCLGLGLVLLIFLTNIIFNVEVIHNDEVVRNKMLEELEKYDIKKYKMVKTYEEIESIKKHILEKYKDEIEWLEIERFGTTYTLRLEERIKKREEKQYPNQDVIAKYNAVILEIDAINGDVLKKVGDYVKKGDTIITGNINLYEETKALTSARGTIMGEVWLNVKTEIPIHYYKKQVTKNKKNIYYLKILDNNIYLFNKPYKTSDKKQTTLLKNNLIPIQLIKEQEKEVILKDEIYLKDELLNKAKEEAINKVKESLGEKEEILTIKKLKEEEKDSTIVVEFFMSVKKDITSYKEVYEVTEENDV